jgi:hypothetical protein
MVLLTEERESRLEIPNSYDDKSMRTALNARVALRAPAVSLASQVTGLVQLVLILARAGTNQSTDAYFYLFNVGLVPIQCIIVGMMYPSLLNDRGMSRAGLARIRWLTPALGLVFVTGGALWLTERDRLPVDLIVLAVLSGLNALVQALLWFKAVAAQAGGNALWISGVALPANILAVVALAYPWKSPPAAMTVMVGALLVGNLGLLVAMTRRKVGTAVLDSVPLVAPSRSGPFWFLGKSTVGYLGQIFLQSLAVLLPASGVTFLNIGVKIVSSVSATFVNATMPSLVHRSTDSPHSARQFLRLTVVVVSLGGAALVAGTWIIWPSLLRPAIVVALWLIASSASAIAAQMSYRFLTPQMSTRTILVVTAVVALTALSSRGAGFDLTVALCAYATIDAASALLLLLPLRDRTMSLLLGGVVAGLASTWITAYL